MVWDKGLFFFSSEYTIILAPLVKKTTVSLLEYTGTIFFENQSTIIGKVCPWALNYALLIYNMPILGLVSDFRGKHSVFGHEL